MARIVRSNSPVSGNGRGGLSYLLPVFAAVVILVLIVKAFFGSSGTDSDANKGDYVTVTPKSENSEVYIYMSGDSKKQITGESKLFSTDNELKVNSGDADITFADEASKISADKLAEISYRGVIAGKKTFDLTSSYIWVEAASANLAFNLTNFKVAPESGAIFALYQNAVGSNLYVLKGNVAVTSETSSTTVGLGQMVMLLIGEVKTAKLPEKITPIEDTFRGSDFFIRHNGSSYLSTSSSVSGGSGSGTQSGTGSTPTPSSTDKPILFTYPEDEMTVTTSTIDIE